MVRVLSKDAACNSARQLKLQLAHHALIYAHAAKSVARGRSAVAASVRSAPTTVAHAGEWHLSDLASCILH